MFVDPVGSQIFGSSYWRAWRIEHQRTLLAACTIVLRAPQRAHGISVRFETYRLSSFWRFLRELALSAYFQVLRLLTYVQFRTVCSMYVLLLRSL